MFGLQTMHAAGTEILGVKKKIMNNFLHIDLVNILALIIDPPYPYNDSDIINCFQRKVFKKGQNVSSLY